MRRLIRTPLAWLIAVELVLTLVLGGWAWHVFASSRSVPATAGDSAPSTEASPHARATPPARPALASAPPRERAASAAAGRPDLNRLNHEQAAWEAAEWRIVSTLIQVGKAYIDRVVMPAIGRARQQEAGR